MTTIAYKDGIIATDSQETCGNRIVDTEADKHRVKNGIHFFLSGAVSSEKYFIDSWFSGEGKEDESCAALVWDGEKLWYSGYESETGKFFKNEVRRENVDTIGSGGDYAMGAMDSGCSAEEAIAVAIKRDIYTGGKIRTYVLGDLND